MIFPFKKSTLIFLISLLSVSALVTIGLARTESNTGWRPFSYFVLGAWCLMIVWSYFKKDDFLKRLLVFATTMGVVELLADWWLVKITKTLHYPIAENHLWQSPWYMPLLWASLPLCLAYAGAALIERFGKIKVLLVQVILGVLLGIFWESLTRFFQGWCYDNSTSMIGQAPLFIVFGEGFIIPFMTWYIWKLSKTTPKIASDIMNGVVMGFSILVAYMLFYYIVQWSGITIAIAKACNPVFYQ